MNYSISGIGGNGTGIDFFSDLIFQICHMNETNQPIILVLDDNPDIRGLCEAMLHLNGFKVITTATISEAKKMLAQNPEIRLILMDMVLSGENGVDFSAELRNSASVSHIPILMMSAHPNAKQLISEGLTDDYIEKPFDLHEMISKIRNLLERSVAADS